jgi:hypothetical protein
MGLSDQTCFCQQMLNRNEITMHDLIIASSLVAMLVVPCFATLKAEVSTDEQE